MYEETIVSIRADRELRKQIIKPGDYSIVPYEESRCKVIITDLSCKNSQGNCPMEADCRVFNPSFDGNILIGDYNCFIDRDFELILSQMCMGEVCTAKMTYKDHEDKLALEITCKIDLKDVMEEQLISDWSWQRLHEASLHHKEQGVQLVKEKKIKEAFTRFSRSLKFLVAIEPVDPTTMDEEKIKEFIDLKVKLYNNLAHCQLHYDEHEAGLELCNKALSFDPVNIKALYRRCNSYIGLNQLEEAWSDIQKVLKLDPQDKLAQQKASFLKPKVELLNKNYESVIKKMFV